MGEKTSDAIWIARIGPLTVTGLSLVTWSTFLNREHRGEKNQSAQQPSNIGS